VPRDIDRLAVNERWENAANGFYQWNVAVHDVAKSQINRGLLCGNPFPSEQFSIHRIESFDLHKFQKFNLWHSRQFAFDVNDELTRFAPHSRHTRHVVDWVGVVRRLDRRSRPNLFRFHFRSQ
jgi:hypothetical protein